MSLDILQNKQTKKSLITSDDLSIPMLMALSTIYCLNLNALHAYFTVTRLCSMSLLIFALLLAGIPDQEPHYDDGHAPCDDADQQSSHIDFLPLILSCKYN